MSTETNQKELKEVSPEDRARVLKRLRDNQEVLELQALIAEARMRIKKANLEELLYSLKHDEFKNPPKNDGAEQAKS